MSFPPSTVDWFDVDYPEVIELRKNFYSDGAFAWSLLQVTAKNDLVARAPYPEISQVMSQVAEGLLEYLTEQDVKTLLNSG